MSTFFSSSGGSPPTDFKCEGSSMVERPANQQENGGPIPTPSLHFLEIETRQATALVIEHHYLHRKCPISFCWAIEVEGKILGVLTVGKPCSWSATCGVVGEKFADMNDPLARSKDVFELNRLWVHDSLPRNTESQFIGWCLRQIKRVHPNIILISYADGSRKNPDGRSHVGIVYQATNWIYAGTSAAFVDITLKGYSDYRSVPMEKRGAKVGNKRAWAKNPDAIRTTRSPKHRYVWFSNPADQRLLAWPKQPFPKKAAA
jgi:hypothetical protein